MSSFASRRILTTSGVVSLYVFQPEDITPTYLGWLNDPVLMRFSNQRFKSHTVESSAGYLSSFQNSSNLFLVLRAGGQQIGTMTAYVTPHHGTADMGLLVGPEFHGRGFGADAWGALMRHLFAGGVRKITGGTVRPNVAMARIMKGCGMVPDGVRVGQELIEGCPEDVLHFAKFRD